MNLNEYQKYHESKVHTSVDFPYNTYLCTIPLDFTLVPMHWHEEIELIVIQKGRGIVSVDFDRRQVRAGDLVFIRPGQLHSIEQDGTAEMQYENIILKREFLVADEGELCTGRFIDPLLDGKLVCSSFLTSAGAGYPELSDCIIRIDRLCAKRPKGYQLAVKGLLFQFLFFLISNSREQDALPASQTRSMEKIKQVLKYVQEHYPERITAGEAAELIYYSKSHFMKFFRMYMGASFIDYLNDYRLTIAEQRLRTTDDPVLEIAQSCGFDNLSYFNRLFKRKYGQSPTGRRKSAGRV